MAGGGWLEQIAAGTTELAAELLFLHRRPRAEEVAGATAALQALDEIEAHEPVEEAKTREIDARALYDRRLIGAKEPLRRYPAVRVRCRCGRSLEWIAVAPRADHGLQLVHGPRLVEPNERRGGAEDIVAGVRQSRFAPTRATGTATWAKDTEAGVGHSRTLPNGPHGDVYGLKAHYRCPKCAYEETVLHVTLLRRFLTAVVAGEREVRLGALPGAAQSSKPRVVRVGARQGAAAWSTRAGRAKR
ncbi:MAG: hypothetical protein M0Z46_09120 [Actinomycetota bacterium]|nr:hypothetical protein [Actinomycetota bacterium]